MQMTFLYRILASGLLLCGAASVAFAVQDQQQDQQQDQDQPVETAEAPELPETTGIAVSAAANDGKSNRRTLYFLGPRVAQERQQGPSVGAPISILPQPFVAVGSLSVPEPPAVQDEEDASALLVDDNDGVVTESADDVVQQPELPPGTVETDGQTSPADELTQAGEEQPADVFDPLAIDGFSEGTLTRIDPSGLPVSLEGRELDTVWQGYDRATIKEFLDLIARPSQSPTLANFASAIASSRFDLPIPENDDDIIDLIEARLSVFQSQADRQGYVALIDALPTDRDWTSLAHHFARAHLLKGQLPDACQIAETERANDQDTYWLRLSAFCQAAAGNRAGVDFQLGILEETTNVDQIFYQMIDQILVEAEQPPGTVLPPIVALESPLPADILTASMVRLARISVAEIDAVNVNPLAVPLLLENPLLSRSAQSTLIEYLVARGVADGEMVSTFVRSAEITEEELDATRIWLSSLVEGDEGEDTAENAEEATVAAPFETADLQAALLKLVFLQQDDASLALQQYWKQSAERNQLPGVAPVLKDLVSASNVTTGLADPRSIAIFARAALLAEDEAVADAWIRRLRISVAGEDADVDQALISLSPLLDSGKWGETDTQVTVSQRWLMLNADLNARYREANLLFSLLESLDETVPTDMWALLNSGPVLFEGGSISPSVWRAYLISLNDGDPIASLSMIYKIMSEVGPGDMPPAMAGSIVRGLYQLGFEAAARALALEILISQKI